MNPQRATLSGKHCSFVYPKATEKGTQENLCRDLNIVLLSITTLDLGNILKIIMPFHPVILWCTLRICAPTQRITKEKRHFLSPLWGISNTLVRTMQAMQFSHKDCSMSTGKHRLSTEGQGWSLSGVCPLIVRTLEQQKLRRNS